MLICVFTSEMMKLITSGPLHTMPWSGKAMCWLVLIYELKLV